MPAENFVAEAWSMWAISILVVCLRLYARISTYGIKNFALDDALMIGAALVYTAETTAAYVVGAYFFGIANSGITDAQRAAIVPGSVEWNHRVGGSKTHVFGWYTYTGVFWLLKGCWIVFYGRLTEGVAKLEKRVKIGYWLIGLTYLAVVCVVTFKCVPFHRQWQIYPDPGNNCQPGYSKLQVSFVLAMNLITDIYLIFIPLPMIHASTLPIKKKLSLFILFGTTFVTMAFGILRCVTLLTAGATDPSQSGTWSVRESFLAVLVSNFPMIAPLLQRWFRKVTGLSTLDSSSGNNSYPLSKTKTTTKNSRKGKFAHPLSIPNETAWESDEAIMTRKAKDAEEEYTPSALEQGRSPMTKPQSDNKGYVKQDDGRMAHNDNGQITVVREYSVQTTEDQPREHKSFLFLSKDK